MMEEVPDEYSECYAGYHSNLDRLDVLMQDPDEDKKGKRKKGKGQLLFCQFVEWTGCWAPWGS